MGNSGSLDSFVDSDRWKKPEEVNPYAAIVRKLKESERKRRALGSSAPEPTEEQFQALARRLGDVEEMVTWLKVGMPANGMMPWKLVITAIPPPGSMKPIVNFFARNTSYGVVHAGVQLGRLLIDWNNSGLIEPRLLKGKSLLAALDLDLVSNDLSTNDALLRQIATLIVDWNLTKSYNQTGCNCQHFVDELFSRGLGITPQWPPAIARYLAAVREDSDYGLPHYINERGQRVYFESHRQLDEYVQRYDASITRDERTLFKAFDRAYMIKWRTSGMNDQLSEPHNPTRELRCAVFGLLTGM